MKKFLFLFIFLVNLAIIIYLWLSQSGQFLLAGPAGLLISLSRLAGLLAVYLVLWQLVIIGRIKFLEQVFGFDRLAVFHHFNGLVAWILIFLHPVLIIFGRAKLNGISFGNQLLDSLLRGDDLLNAFLALVTFAIVIGLSYRAIRKKVKYETWYYVHLMTYLAIILAFGHQLEMGYDLQSVLAIAYWYLLYALAVIPLAYYRLFKPLWLFYQHRFFVDRVVTENQQVVSVYIKGRSLDKFVFQGGQFVIVRFLDANLAWQAHPFSLSQAFNGQELRLTIKNLGDFTAALSARLRPGYPLILEGPYGIFTQRRAKGEKLALIAGGIGITPLRSLIEAAPEKDKVLLYSVGRAEELVLKAELDGLSGEKFRPVYLVREDEKQIGDDGHLNETKLKNLLPDYQERDFYLCGPWSMIKSVRRLLQKLGVKKNRIYFEKFSLS